MKWLPAEPGIVNPERSQRLTNDYLLPNLAEIETFLLELRERVDCKLNVASPLKYGTPYPLSQCLEISKAMKLAVDNLDESEFSGPVLVGCQAIQAFRAAGGEMRRVWGDLRGAYFQNAFQVGTLYVDVANDTVITTNPKVEILPFAQSGLAALKDYAHFARVAESYWEVKAWPNHVVPEISAFFPLLSETRDGGFELRDMGGYMMSLNLNRAFGPAEAYLSQVALPEGVLERAACDLMPLIAGPPKPASLGRRESLKTLQRYRSERIHLDTKAQRRLIDLGLAVNRTFSAAVIERGAPQRQRSEEAY